MGYNANISIYVTTFFNFIGYWKFYDIDFRMFFSNSFCLRRTNNHKKILDLSFIY